MLTKIKTAVAKRNLLGVTQKRLEESIDSRFHGNDKQNGNDKKNGFQQSQNGDTTGYRVLFGESDGFPGFIVDKYNDVIVIQISIAGVNKLRDVIIDCLKELFNPRAIVERSDSPSRKEEGMESETNVISGDNVDKVVFKESGINFCANVLSGQKTGFYFDQREVRKVVKSLAKDRRVLNLFSYTGATGIYAMLGGALNVHNVDSSVPALELCKENAGLNSIDLKKFSTESADVFQWIAKQTEQVYDMIIIDPPALIKSQRSIKDGFKAYHFINRASLRILTPGGVLVTSSCSQHFGEQDFVTTLRRAALQSDRKVDVLDFIKQSSDHPVSLYFPESYYLKTFVCYIN